MGYPPFEIPKYPTFLLVAILFSSFYRSSTSKRPPLRIGLLLDSPINSKVIEVVLEDISASNFANLELVVLKSPPPQEQTKPQTKSSLRRIFDILCSTQRRKMIAFELYQRFDRRFYSLSDDPLASIDCSRFLEGVETIHVEPVTQGFTHRVPPEAIDAIRLKELDVILRFGFNILRGDILTCAKYGIWSYHHGDNDYYRGGPPYFWEVYENNSISGVILQVLTEELDAGQVLCKSLFATASGISVLRNRYAPYWGSTYLVIQKLYELHQYGWGQVQSRVVKSQPYVGKRAIYRRPTNWEVCRWFIPALIKKALRRVVREETVSHWRIALRIGKRRVFGLDRNADMDGFVWWESPQGHFYADPFLHGQDGKNWLFFEDFRYAENRAVICCSEVKADGSIGEPEVCLDRNYHLSYPSVFRYEGETYMVPETQRNRTIELFRATSFPLQWELDRTLLGDIDAVDVTFWAENGLCWWFVTALETRGESGSLLLFYSHGIAGEWVYHPSNPISTDIRNLRSAGMPFRHDGKLIRLSQDCSHCYGYSFSFSEILTLTTDKYEERTLTTVDPSWSLNLTGTHTYNRCGDIEVVDGSIDMPHRQKL